MSTWKEKYNRKYGYPKNKSHSLEDISKETGVSMKGIQQIYNKGIGAYKTNPESVRDNVKSKEQWAYARVYSAVMGGDASKVDTKELKMEKGGVFDIFHYHREEIENYLNSLGLEYRFVGQSDANGISIYYKVLYDGNEVKARFSDHSVTNPNRFEEAHFGLENFDDRTPELMYKLGHPDYIYAPSKTRVKQIEIPIKKLRDGDVEVSRRVTKKGNVLVTVDRIEHHSFKYQKKKSPNLKMKQGGNLSGSDRLKYKKDYYDRLSPKTDSVDLEENKIIITPDYMEDRYFKKGGETTFNPDGAIKGKIVHASGSAGGMLVGKRHSKGGIKAINKSTGQPLEMEGGEVVITRNAVSDNKKRSFNGKMMTNREILSAINQSGGGVSFADGGEVPSKVTFDCNAQYEYNGNSMCGKDLAYALGGEIHDEELDSALDELSEIMEEGGEITDYSYDEIIKLLESILPKETGKGKNKIKLFLDNNVLFIKFGASKPQSLSYLPRFFNPKGKSITSIIVKGILHDIKEELFTLSDLITFFENIKEQGIFKLTINTSDNEEYSLNTIRFKNRKPTGWKKRWEIGKKNIKKDFGLFLDILNKHITNETISFNIINFVLGEISDDLKENQLFSKFKVEILEKLKHPVSHKILQDESEIAERITFDDYNFAVTKDLKIIYPTDLDSFLFLRKHGEIPQDTEPEYIKKDSLEPHIKNYDKLIASVSKELKLNLPILTKDEIAIYQRRISNLINNQRKLQEEENASLNILDRVKNAYDVDFGNIDKKYTSTDLIAINGKKSQLTDYEYKLVRTRAFKTFFGDWELAYETGDYNLCSKIINQETKEPLAVFHGSDTLFTEFQTYNTNQLHYFAKKRAMANFFATSWKLRGDEAALDSKEIKQLNPMKGEFIYRNFLDIRNPIDFSRFGVDKRPIKDFLNFLKINYNIDDFNFVTTGSKLGQDFLEKEVFAWQIIRTWQDFNVYIKNFTQYDGYVFYEYIPDIKLSERQGLKSASLSFCAFESNQIKLSESQKFNALIDDIRFDKGGVTSN